MSQNDEDSEMREEGSTLLEKYFINIERGDTGV